MVIIPVAGHVTTPMGSLLEGPLVLEPGLLVGVEAAVSKNQKQIWQSPVFQ